MVVRASCSAKFIESWMDWMLHHIKILNIRQMFQMRIYNINIIIFEMPRNYPLRQLCDNII
jgi:hypothetical protein